MSFTTGNDILILQASDKAIVGAGPGNDRYVLDASVLATNQRITLSDTQGTNTLHLIGGLRIVSSKVAATALQLTLNNGAVITLLGPDAFNYATGGNPLNGSGALVQNFADFVSEVLKVSVPPPGGAFVNGGSVIVNQNGGSTSAETPVLVAPVTSPAMATGAQGASEISVNLSGSDTDGTVTSFVIKSLPANATLKSGSTTLQVGSVVAATNNTASVTLVPEANFNGSITFTFAAKDNASLEDATPATATVTVTPANSAPTGGADSVVTNQNTAATYTAAQLLANDTDADGDALFIKSVSSGTGGTVVRNPNGSVTFTPNTNFSGNATFSYVASDGKGGDSAPIPVTVNVATANRAPVGGADSVAATQNRAATYAAAQLLANDTDADGDALFIKTVSTSTGGTAVLNANGSVTFTPNTNYSGLAYFYYIASDGKGGDTDWTLVTINVASANNAPIIFGVPSAAERVTVGTPTALSDFSVSDPDGADVNLRVTLTASNGQINNVSDMDANQSGVQLSGTAASINQILAGATFTATTTGSAQIGISVTDGVASNPSTAVYALTAVLPANQAPQLTLPRNTIFSGGVDYTQQNLPLSLKSADINRDGLNDLINLISGAVDGYQVLLNQGNGNFLRVTTAFNAVIDGFDELHVADVNKDGSLDLIISSFNGDKFYVTTGSGDGSFGAPISFATDFEPSSITSGDTNGDGIVDIMVGYQYKQAVSFFLGKANGGFESRVDYSLLAGSASGTTVTSVDVHGDGRDDLIVTDANNSIYLMAGKSDGKFNPSVKYQTGRNPNSVIGSDLNGDGKPDIITTNGGGGSISVLLNNGSGGLLAQTEYGTGSTPVSVVAKDVNGDGRPDLLVANQAGDSVSVLINRGNGTFNASVNYPTNDYPNSLTSADINNDGWSDILTASGRGFGNSISVRLNGGLTTPYVANDLVQVNKALTLSDPDGNSNWDGGRLSIQISGNAASNDQLTLPDFNQGGNSVWIDEPNGNALMVGNTAIGTANALNANGATVWQFTFNANATNILVQTAARAVSFKNTSDTPPPGIRTVKFTATDKFGASVSADMPVTVFNFKSTVISTSSTSSAMEFKGAEHSQMQEGFSSTTSYSSEHEDYEWTAPIHGEVPIELNGVSTIQLSAVGL